MTNAELIDALRNFDLGESCPCENQRMCEENDCIVDQAADALEAADEKIADYTAAVDAFYDSNDAYIKENERLKKRIAELEDDLRNGTISNPERIEIYGYKVKELILFADMCKRNDVQEADLKQAAWNMELAVRAVMNERQEIVKNTMNEIAMRFTPDFEKAFAEMMGKEQTDDAERC